ncbi:MAG TPA: RNA methyltransferase [Burkholderiales bacterium]|nr:RNA methyltransferase [Burkholderiales bacterium]HEX2651869.1 RNA methyltransferase [Burkholderiales bacterium]
MRLDHVRIVLCRPQHPGNIGAAARAMKTMGLSDLRLVAPLRYPDPESQWMATHALDVLQAAQVHAKLEEAISDCVAAFALSVRPREWAPAVLEARAAAAKALELEGKVAFVFGAERTGLENDEVFACQYLVHIPSSPGQGSLNLAQAVQVVAYELFMATAAGAIEFPEKRRKRATVQDLEGLYAHLEQAAVGVGFLDPGSGSKLRERWRRLFARAELEREEVNILRGLLNALQAPKSK